MVELADSDGATLLTVAWQAIDTFVEHRTQLQVDQTLYSAPLRAKGASFVTLRRADGSLRGCMGSSMALHPLIDDVAGNTYAAASRDPRFASLQAHERTGLGLSVSVLSSLQRMEVVDEADLVRQLRVGIDGLLLSDDGRRATLLPSVWEVLPDAARFVAEVKTKAGWPDNYWSPSLQAFRYTARTFSSP